MSTPLFSGDIWTDSELEALLKKLEKMYAGGVRQSTFKDQTLIFASTSELTDRITKIRTELCDRGVLTSTSGTTKKRVRTTTRNKGFI